MTTRNPGSKERSARAHEFYNARIRRQVETSENIGKLVVIVLDSRNFAVDPRRFDSARTLRAKTPDATLFAIQFGYTTAAGLGGVLERSRPSSSGKAEAFRCLIWPHERLLYNSI